MKKRRSRGAYKRSNRVFYIIAICAALLIALSMSYLSGKKTEQPAHMQGFSVENAKTTSFSFDRHVLEFSVFNNGSVPGNCTAEVTLDGKRGQSPIQEPINVKLGVIAPMQRRLGRALVSFGNDESGFNISSKCFPADRQRDYAYLSACNFLTFGECVTLLRNPDAEQCTKREPWGRNLCFAVLSGNDAFCGSIVQRQERVNCISYVTKNPSLCEDLDIQLERDSCYQNYGINTKDGEICNLISDKSKKNSCLGAIALNPDACKGLNEDDKELCIFSIAESTNNPGLCERLANSKDCRLELS